MQGTQALSLLDTLGLDRAALPGAGAGTFRPPAGPELITENPATGESLGVVRTATLDDYDAVVAACAARFTEWRLRPAPKRAELVRALGELLREHKTALGEIISFEVGKIRSEGLGEVQEMIDVCDFAVGLSRQLHGLTIASERPGHRMMEQWHPLGPVAAITAFNFPMAVWAWNAAIAAVCGDTVVWKPSPLAPLSSIAVHALCVKAMESADADSVFGLLAGDTEIGKRLADDRRFPLVSFTGSIEAGRSVATKVASRLGRSLLELGGNNGILVLSDADLDLATRAITFGAVGTAGQRCTTTRRVFVEEPVSRALLDRLVRAYRSVKLGDPLRDGVLLGPLISARAVAAYEQAILRATALGGQVLTGGRAVPGSGHFVEPTIILAPDHASFEVAWEETFAPILYVPVDSYEQALRHHNAVPQGLSSAIFTDSSRRGRALPRPRRLRLRHRQREHRHERRRDRRRVRRREGPARPRVRLRRLEEQHAPPDLHGELLGARRLVVRRSISSRRSSRRMIDSLATSPGVQLDLDGPLPTPHHGSSPGVRPRRRARARTCPVRPAARSAATRPRAALGSGAITYSSTGSWHMASPEKTPVVQLQLPGAPSNPRAAPARRAACSATRCAGWPGSGADQETRRSGSIPSCRRASSVRGSRSRAWLSRRACT
ncbi:MAG: aldehyde dehydrogenase family protein [Polyangiaceae bacterium]